MKKIYLIGIGPGNPDYLTVQAINTMKRLVTRQDVNGNAIVYQKWERKVYHPGD